MTPEINVLIYEKTDNPLLEARLRQREHWWVYISEETGKFSKVRARVNPADFLVTGQDLQTKIVCIQDETLTLSDHGCVDAVRFDDPRLSVLLPSNSKFITSRQKRISDRKNRKEVKVLLAAHHFVFHSKNIRDIAKVVNVTPETLTTWVFDEEGDWETALELWAYTGDPIPEGAREVRESLALNYAGKTWTKLFEALMDVCPFEVSSSLRTLRHFAEPLKFI